MPRLFRRIREIFESIVYAGLQPGSQPAPRKRVKWLGPLNGPIERLLSGGPAPIDPLYLTNRTTGQRIRTGLLIGVPCAVLGFLVYGMLTGVFRLGGPPPPVHEPTPAEIADKLMPHIDPGIRLEADKEVEVMEVRVEHGPQTSLVGSMKNTTDHEIHLAEAVFDLTDSVGSQLGGVSATIENFKAGSTASFRVPIRQSDASFALVREIHTQ